MSLLKVGLPGSQSTPRSSGARHRQSKLRPTVAVVHCNSASPTTVARPKSVRHGFPEPSISTFAG
ncbi:hypothetical protein M405DRAFT_804126 [Rhizopogon salebrosus TDB-379]|nr:hypothetical protein M405DRAFT_804126 [Rhizopogon salebrosus TDB-379]